MFGLSFHIDLASVCVLSLLYLIHLFYDHIIFAFHLYFEKYLEKDEDRHKQRDLDKRKITAVTDIRIVVSTCSIPSLGFASFQCFSPNLLEACLIFWMGRLLFVFGGLAHTRSWAAGHECPGTKIHCMKPFLPPQYWLNPIMMGT